MGNLHVPLLFVPTFILLSCSIMYFVSSISQLQTAQNQCLVDQRSALVELQLALYHSQNFTFTSKAELWDLNTDCCSWKGVMCDGLGYVISLDLNYKNLSGSLQSIFNLHHLQNLNLAGNNFNTSLFPFQFDRLPNLTHLNLSASCFHGQVPLGISYLTRLVSLDLSSQDLCYARNDQTIDYYTSLPSKYITFRKFYSTPGYFLTLKLEEPNFETIIKNMKSLTELHLDGLNISAQSSKWCETISLALPKLRVLSLSSCGLTGPFCSSFTRLQFLSKLNLNRNPISYLPPNFLEMAASLVSLSLAACNLSGHLPTRVFLLPKIQRIKISRNSHLSGQLPEFSLNNTLQVLSLYETNFSGKLPESIGNLMSLTALDLSDCIFSGKIPSSVANLTNLVELDLSDNQLYGSLPSTLFTLPSLKVLIVEVNQFDGKIHEFPNASSSLIEYLDLGYNHFRGSIPESILQLPRLEGLFLGYNSFGPMKLDMISQMKSLRFLHLFSISLLSIESVNKKSHSFHKLEILGLKSCNLTEFPEFIKAQEKLVRLYLSNNQIHGFVPTWLWKSTLLELDLSYNAIDFPKQFPFDDANYHFPMLRFLSLQNCNLSEFPEFLKSQENLESLDLSNNRISGAVPNWVWKKSLQYLYLSHNRLSSLDQFLPNQNQSITSSQSSSPRPICNLSQLWTFNASYNNLSGPIPNCLGNISTLNSLALQKQPNYIYLK